MIVASTVKLAWLKVWAKGFVTARICCFGSITHGSLDGLEIGYLEIDGALPSDSNGGRINYAIWTGAIGNAG